MTNGQSGIVYLCITIGLQVISQLLFKARSVAFLGKKESGDSVVGYLMAAFSDPLIWLAMVCALVGMVTWLLALAEVELSVAYPIVSITFPIVAVMGVAIWSEPLSPTKIAGILLMFIGLLVISIGHPR